MARSTQNPIPSLTMPLMSVPHPHPNLITNGPLIPLSQPNNSITNGPLMSLYQSQPNDPSSNGPLTATTHSQPHNTAVNTTRPLPAGLRAKKPSKAKSSQPKHSTNSNGRLTASSSQSNNSSVNTNGTLTASSSQPNHPSVNTNGSLTASSSQPNHPSVNTNGILTASSSQPNHPGVNTNGPLTASSFQQNNTVSNKGPLVAGSQAQVNQIPTDNNLQLALAMALVRSGHRLNHSVGSLSPSASSNQILHWKNKAKERKREISRLREEIKLLQDGAGCESEPPIVSCKCHFFEGCGEAGPIDGTGDLHWIDEVLRRRFLRLVRWKERRKRVERSFDKRNFMEFESDDEIGRLSVSIDFLVELSDKVLAKGEVDSSFSSFSHQAIDFILGSMKNILASKKQGENLEEITNGMIIRLIKRMCTESQNCQLDSGLLVEHNSDPQFCVQHLMRQLGQEIFVGQRLILTLSQNISILAETLLLIDPFHDNYPILDSNMFLLIQLIEFLVSDYIKGWLSFEQFDKSLFEEWVRSILKARNDLRILENMNGLYILYLDRVTGLIVKEVGPSIHEGKLDPQVFAKLLS